jgi:hypothetical protein
LIKLITTLAKNHKTKDQVVQVTLLTILMSLFTSNPSTNLFNKSRQNLVLECVCKTIIKLILLTPTRVFRISARINSRFKTTLGAFNRLPVERAIL